ncbi:MAG: Arm DNA-binding domain-containing protein, partial [Gammaproteobacteria bacterium]
MHKIQWTAPGLKGVRHSGRTDNKGRPIKDRYSENNDRRNVGRLIFEVLPSGKSFYFQYFPKDGSRRLVRIGPFKADNTTPGYTLAEAREKRDNYSRLLQGGIDIKTYIEQRREAEQQRVRDHEDSKRNGTFGQLLDSYVLWMKAGGKRSYQSVNDSLTTYVR